MDQGCSRCCAWEGYRYRVRTLGRLAAPRNGNVDAVAILTPITCKAARAGLDVPMRDLARLADISTNTLVRFESGAELREKTLQAIQAALEAAGATFLPDDGTGPGVRLRRSAGAAGDPAPFGG